MATTDLDRVYDDAGKRWDIDPHLLRAVHQVEDPTDNPNATSHAGAIGYMQFMPATARSLNIDPHSPKQSIYGAARLLNENIHRYGNVGDALRAYNGGTNKVHWNNPETSTYSKKVAAAYHQLKEHPNMPDQNDPFMQDYGQYLTEKAPSETNKESQPEQSGWSKAGTFAGDFIKSANNEVVKTTIPPIMHLLGYASSLGGHLYNPHTLYENADHIKKFYDDRDAENARDWGASVSQPLGRGTGDLIPMLATEGTLSAAGSALSRTNMASKIAGDVLKGQGVKGASTAHNALLGAALGYGTSDGKNPTNDAVSGAIEGAVGAAALHGLYIAGGKIVSHLPYKDNISRALKSPANALLGTLRKESPPPLPEEGDHSHIIDRIADEEKKFDLPGTRGWDMSSKNGHDNRNDPRLERPIVLGTMKDPQTGNDFPLIVQQGYQNTRAPRSQFRMEGLGLDHIEYGHGQAIRKSGYENALTYLQHIAENGNELRFDPKTGSYTLIAPPLKNGNKRDMAVIKLARHDNDHFKVITAYPNREANINRASITDNFNGIKQNKTSLGKSSNADIKKSDSFFSSPHIEERENLTRAEGENPDVIDTSGAHGQDLGGKNRQFQENVNNNFYNPSRKQQNKQSRAGTFSPFLSPKQVVKKADEIIKAFGDGSPVDLVHSSIPGVVLTKAEATGNKGIATLENHMRDLYPNAFQLRDASNNQARQAYLRTITGTSEDLENAEKARASFEDAHRAVAFGNEQPINIDHLHNAFEQAKSVNQGNPFVQSKINQAHNALKSLPSSKEEIATALPSHLWNVRKYIGYGLKTATKGERDDLRAASAHLSPIMDTLANTINEGAPGFHDYMNGYAQHSKAIDEMRWLQGRTLTKNDGDLTLSPISRTLEAIRKSNVSKASRDAGVVSQKKLAQLQALEDDLKRMQAAQNDAKSRGSNTSKNLLQTGKMSNLISKSFSIPAGGGAGFMMSHDPVGATVGGVMGHVARHVLDKKTATTKTAIENQLLKSLLNER